MIFVFMKNKKLAPNGLAFFIFGRNGRCGWHLPICFKRPRYEGNLENRVNQKHLGKTTV